MPDERVITWVIGDPSDDGHGKSTFGFFKTNLSSNDILKINHHLSNTWDMCLDHIHNGEYKTKENAIVDEYEECYLTQEQLDMLRSKGFDFWGDSSDNPEDYFMYHELFFDIGVFCIKTGAKELGMENVIFEQIPDMEKCPLGGAYGIF